MRTATLLLLTAAFSLIGCGDGTDTSSGATASTSTGSGGGGGAGGGGGGEGGSNAGGAGPGSEKIIFNELNARSPLVTDVEWIEIANTGDQAFSLNGYAITDTSGAVAGTPNLMAELRFPPEAVIPANGYFIILCDQPMEPSPVAHKDCLPTAPAGTVCYHVTWKISASTGERVFFLAPNNSIIATADYPEPAVGTVVPVDGETWGRLPDLTGEFGITAPTPGAPNMAVMP